jgi:homoserine kinase
MPPIASVDVPASSANLGSGFDCFAAALSLKMRAELWHGDESGIVLNSRGEGTPRDDEPADDNLLIRAFREGLRISAAPGGASWRLEVSSMIPAARGLGSSAAAIVAGAVLGAAVGRRTVEADELLALAARPEGHPDNAAAALLGGFVICADGGATRFDPPDGLAAVVVVPAEPVHTTQARAALPAEVPMAEAVFNTAHGALLMLGLIQNDWDLVARGLADRLHQPHRAHLYPQSAELAANARELGALGATISGAGPTVLVWTHYEATGPVMRRLEALAEGWAEVQRVGFEPQGADVREL